MLQSGSLDLDPELHGKPIHGAFLLSFSVGKQAFSLELLFYQKFIENNCPVVRPFRNVIWCTLPMDQLLNLIFQFESIFNLEFQPRFGIQLRIPIPKGITLGECVDLRTSRNM